MIFQQHDGVVVDMVEKFLQGFVKRLQERGGRWEREAAARVQGCCAPALLSSLYRREGAVGGAPNPSRAGQGRKLTPQGSP